MCTEAGVENAVSPQINNIESRTSLDIYLDLLLKIFQKILRKFHHHHFFKCY